MVLNAKLKTNRKNTESNTTCIDIEIYRNRV